MLINFICTGNTCRSPMAEAMMREELKSLGIEGIEVISSGNKACYDCPMSPYSAECLRMMNITVLEHKSRLLTRELYNKCDYNITMTVSHLRCILSDYGDNGRIYTLNELVGCGDIEDPYSGDILFYRRVAIILYDAIKKLPRTLSLIK